MTDDIVDYLEVKHQLLMCYCVNMTFYLYMKVNCAFDRCMAGRRCQSCHAANGVRVCRMCRCIHVHMTHFHAPLDQFVTLMPIEEFYYFITPCVVPVVDGSQCAIPPSDAAAARAPLCHGKNAAFGRKTKISGTFGTYSLKTFPIANHQFLISWMCATH